MKNKPKINKFWNWKNVVTTNDAGEQSLERTLFLNGTIASESWFEDDVTPAVFKNELLSGSGDITIWINSPGGDCVAAAQIYNMLMDYPGNVTVKIDGMAASAASVIAMAGTRVLASPVSMMMIHDPSTIAWGNKDEMNRAIAMLDETKESIINAYEIKTGLSRNKISRLMSEETWMNAKKAVELGFADEILTRRDESGVEFPDTEMLYSPVQVTNSLMDKIAQACRIEPQEAKEEKTKVSDLLNHLNEIKHWR